MPKSLSLSRKEEQLVVFPKNLVVLGVSYQTRDFSLGAQSGPKILTTAHWKSQSISTLAVKSGLWEIGK